jgi:hypothetical protein
VTEDNKTVKMSFYIDEETRTRFKLACTATGTSMNQVLVDMVNGWLDSNDPFKKNPPTFGSSSGSKGRGKKGDASSG